MRWTKLIAITCFSVAGLAYLPGCDDDKEVLEVETPSGELEIEQDEDTGDVDVNVNDK